MALTPTFFFPSAPPMPKAHSCSLAVWANGLAFPNWDILNCYSFSSGTFTPIGNFSGFLNDDGVLQLPVSNTYPTSSSGLPPGAVWSDGLTVAIVPGIIPSSSAPPVYFGSITSAQLLSLGGGNLPTIKPTVGSLQLWNNTTINNGIVCIA